MGNGTDVQLELSDHELGLSDHNLQTASFSSHHLRISPTSLLYTLRRTSFVPHLLQVLITIGWQVAHFGPISRWVQSVQGSGSERVYLVRCCIYMNYIIIT
jgi:hypothetical protein